MKEYASPGGPQSQPYGIAFAKGAVWYSESGVRPNTLVRFDPVSEKFETFPSDKRGASVRQMLGRPGEAWGGESGNDRLVVVRD